MLKYKDILLITLFILMKFFLSQPRSVPEILFVLSVVSCMCVPCLVLILTCFIFICLLTDIGSVKYVYLDFNNAVSSVRQ